MASIVVIQVGVDLKICVTTIFHEQDIFQYGQATQQCIV